MSENRPLCQADNDSKSEFLSYFWQNSPIVRLGMEDRILMVAKDHFSPMRGSVCLSPCSQSSSIRAGLSPGNSYPGLGRKATSSVVMEGKTKQRILLLAK